MENQQLINNAGMIILWPFLSMLFEQSALLDDRHQFKNTTSQTKAAQLLQYAVTGHDDLTDNEQATLHKIGKLVTGTNKITLTVERKVLDVLVNQLP